MQVRSSTFLVLCRCCWCYLATACMNAFVGAEPQHTICALLYEQSGALLHACRLIWALVHCNTRSNQQRGLDLAQAALDNDQRSQDQDRELQYYLAGERVRYSSAYVLLTALRPYTAAACSQLNMVACAFTRSAWQAQRLQEVFRW